MLRAASSSFATFSPSDAENGITTEGLDFILNYDIKYRLGRATEIEED